MSYRADKLVIDTHTLGHTDPQTQPMTIPEGQNWPRVKTGSEDGQFVFISRFGNKIWKFSHLNKNDMLIHKRPEMINEYFAYQ